MKLFPAGWLSEKNKLATSTAWIWLYEINLPSDPPSKLYIAESQSAVNWGGQTYDPWPIQHGVENETGDGKFNSVTVSVSNVTREIQGYLEQWQYLRGQKVKIRLVNPASPDFSQSSELYIAETSSDEKTVTFSLALNFDALGVVIGRRFYRDKCHWRYKTPECGYTGALTECAKTLGGATGCRAHGNSLRFGAAPGLPQGAVIIG